MKPLCKPLNGLEKILECYRGRFMITTTIYCQECGASLEINLEEIDFNYSDDIITELGWSIISDKDRSLYFCKECG